MGGERREGKEEGLPLPPFPLPLEVHGSLNPAKGLRARGREWKEKL